MKQFLLEVGEERRYAVDCTSLEQITLGRGAFYGRNELGTNRSNTLQMTGQNGNGFSNRVE